MNTSHSLPEALSLMSANNVRGSSSCNQDAGPLLPLRRPAKETFWSGRHSTALADLNNARTGSHMGDRKTFSLCNRFILAAEEVPGLQCWGL